MNTAQIPTGHQQIMPYLIIQGAMPFMQFMEKVFKATQTLCRMRDESFVMHAEISVGNSTIMVADCADQWGMQPAGLFIYVDDADETFKAALEAGASSVMEVSDQSYGRSGGIKDPFGNVWWITSLQTP